MRRFVYCFGGNVMELNHYKLTELKPYDKNPRKNDEAVEYVANSIRDFGFKNPIVIDKNNVIVCGHTRYMAAQRLKLDTVPCVMADDLTDEQIRAFRLADNKVSEIAKWDFDLLNEELEAITDIDMTDFNFEIFEFSEQQEVEQDDEEEKVNERERTFQKYNLELYDEDETDGKYQMPIIRGTNFVPDNLIGFNYAKSSNKKNVGIHCFVDDYQFERLWNNPLDYVDTLLEYQCFLSPDFSLYLDMPIAMKIWNVYRSRLIGQVFQSYGITVIPTVSWAEKETFDFCFDGLPKNSTLAVSTIGVKSDQTAMQIWKDGMDEMIQRLTPKAILVYGGEVEYDYKNIKVIYFENKVTEAMQNGR